MHFRYNYKHSPSAFRVLGGGKQFWGKKKTLTPSAIKYQASMLGSSHAEIFFFFATTICRLKQKA